jgi:hypothetical protein
MSTFSESDEELERLVQNVGGPVQQTIVAELHRRDSAKLRGEIASVRDGVSSIRSDLSHVQPELKTLEKSHRVHVRILVIAIATAVLAFIAALDVVLKWIH